MIDHTTFQSRLNSRVNKIAQKLYNNTIRLTGTTTDCIHISVKQTDQWDIISRKIEDINILSVVFPPIKDLEYRILVHSSGAKILTPYMEDNQSIEVILPINTNVNQNDLLFRFFEIEIGVDPILAVYEIKKLKGTFGERALSSISATISLFDGNLPDTITNWIIDMAKRREELKW